MTDRPLYAIDAGGDIIYRLAFTGREHYAIVRWADGLTDVWVARNLLPVRCTHVTGLVHASEVLTLAVWL